jgi:hypothetical protein
LSAYTFGACDPNHALFVAWLPCADCAWQHTRKIASTKPGSACFAVEKKAPDLHKAMCK